ncbi:MAG: hypothetical protein ACREJ9_02550 [Candidatus Rokuibacteriota bacterium]
MKRAILVALALFTLAAPALVSASGRVDDIRRPTLDIVQAP